MRRSYVNREEPPERLWTPSVGPRLQAQSTPELTRGVASPKDRHHLPSPLSVKVSPLQHRRLLMPSPEDETSGL